MPSTCSTCTQGALTCIGGPAPTPGEPGRGLSLWENIQRAVRVDTHPSEQSWLVISLTVVVQSVYSLGIQNRGYEGVDTVHT